MHDGDSRSPNGVGWLPLQAHKDAFKKDAIGGDSDVAGRPSVLASRRVGWDERWGDSLDDKDTRGDLLGGLCWPPGTNTVDAGGRAIPFWSFAVPAVTVNFTTPGKGPPKSDRRDGTAPPPAYGIPGETPPDSRQPFGASAKRGVRSLGDVGTGDPDVPPVPGAKKYGNFWYVAGGPEDSPGSGWTYYPTYGYWAIPVGAAPPVTAPPPVADPSPPKDAPKRYGPDTVVLPIRGTGFDDDGNLQPGATFDPDFRMAPLTLDTDNDSPQPFMPTWPYGTQNVVLATTNEDRQTLTALHCDPRMVANHKSPNHTDSGSLVYDLKPDGGYDDSRGATLQTAWRVVKDAAYGDGQSYRLSNTLAWNLGVTGGGESRGGMIFDSAYALMGGGGALVGHGDGGPLDVGGGSSGFGGQDKHKIGVDADGNEINVAHISTSAFFRLPGTTSHDGPIDFGGLDVQATDNNFLCKVHWYYDTAARYGWPPNHPTRQASGMWKLYASTLLQVSTPGKPRPPGDGGPGIPPSGPPGGGNPNTPTLQDPSGGFPNNQQPPVTTPGNEFVPPSHGGINYGGSPGGGPQAPNYIVLPVPGEPGYASPGGGYQPQEGPETIGWKGNRTLESVVDQTLGSFRRFASMDRSRRHYGQSTADIAATGFLMHPATHEQGRPDVRVQEGWGDPREMERQEFEQPVTGRRIAYGQRQGGAPVYTFKPGDSRYSGGSGDGGEVILPPEVDLIDLVNGDFDLVTAAGVSKTYEVAGRGARFGSGTPDVVTGGVKDGYSWGHADGSASSDLVFYRHDSAGVATEVMRMRSDGVLFLKNTSPPVGSPSDGAYMWAEAGAIHARGSGGSNTTIAVA